MSRAKVSEVSKTWISEPEAQRAHEAVRAAIELGDLTDLRYAREVLSQLISDITKEEDT